MTTRFTKLTRSGEGRISELTKDCSERTDVKGDVAHGERLVVGMKKRLAFVTTAIAASLALTGTAYADPSIPTPGVGTSGCGVSGGELVLLEPGGPVFSWRDAEADFSNCPVVIETR